MYLKYFGLSESAFNLAPDPRCFYVNRANEEAFFGLRYGIRLRPGLIVLTGESGTGKTHLLRLVKDRCGSNTHLAVVSSRGHGFSALLQLITAALGLKAVPAERSAILQQIRRYLVEQVKNDRVVAVVLDDAQELDLGTLKQLKLLLRPCSSDRSLLQIVLAGRPELETALNNPALKSLKQRVALWSRIRALRPDEVVAYIDHRLTCAGNRLEGLFQPSAVARIAAYSNGIPGMINTICDKALYLAYTRQQEQVSAAVIDDAWETLRQTGETEFEVAALLAEIRLHCRSAMEVPQCTSPNIPVHTAQREWEPLGGEERPSRMKKPVRHHKSVSVKILLKRVQGTMPFWAETMLQRWHQTRDLIASLPNALYTYLGIRQLHELAHGQSKPSPLVIAIVALMAGVGILYSEANKLSVESYESASVPEQTNRYPVRLDAEIFQPAKILQQGQIPQQAEEEQAVNDTSAAENDRKPPTRGSAAIVYVHTSKQGDLPVLEEIGNVLRIDGYTVRDTRFTRNRTQGDVRFFFNGDRHVAERIKSVVQSELEKRGYSISLRLLQRNGKKFRFATPGKIEVWLPPLPQSLQLSRG